MEDLPYVTRESSQPVKKQNNKHNKKWWELVKEHFNQ